MQVNPGSFVLVSGALTELLLSFRPVTSGMREIKVHLVDTETRELVYALIISAEAQGPLVTRSVRGGPYFMLSTYGLPIFSADGL